MEARGKVSRKYRGVKRGPKPGTLSGKRGSSSIIHILHGGSEESELPETILEGGWGWKECPIVLYVGSTAHFFKGSGEELTLSEQDSGTCVLKHWHRHTWDW